MKMSTALEVIDQVPDDVTDLVTEADTNMLIPTERNGETPKISTEDAEKPELLVETILSNGGSSGNIENGNGVCEAISLCPDDNYDEFVRTLIDLKFQNEYLKAQFKGFRDQHLGFTTDYTQQETELGQEVQHADVKNLHEKIASLNRQLEEQKETQSAAEDALKHLRLAHMEADAKVQELATKLTEAQQKMDQEIRERDDKYVELDSKFGRLHKRAKQRIQELQKEKDDVEARLRDVNEVLERASSQQSLAQQELDRTRQQASEALRSLDVERQQLRTTNNRLRDSIDDLRGSLEAKEIALEGLQQSLSEKEQMLADVHGSLQAADEKKQALITELSAKHQKHIESLEIQLADALLDRSKADETISSLQGVIGAKESKIAEMDAASTGEAVRLGAALEAAKGELMHLKNEHEKEKESWEAAYQALKTKLEAFESTYLCSEIEAAKMRSQMELELAVQNQMVKTRDAELAAAKEEINRVEKEFLSYKVRAHALLQKKEAELSTAKDSELIKAQEEAVKAAEREAVEALSERDKALQALQEALTNHDKELAARDAALSDAEQRIKALAAKLDTSIAQYVLEKETWQISLQKTEESWRLKCEALEAQNNGRTTQDLQEKLERLKLQYIRLKEEHDSFRDIADRMVEEKDREISRLLNDNNNLHRSLESRKSVEYIDNRPTTSIMLDAQVSLAAAAEQQILLLARQQAQREDELAQSQRHILALQEEIEELERENRLHNQQEAMLKAEFRNMERMQKREGVDMTYLKNVILKLLETGEVEALLPVIGMLLQFSPDEVKKCQDAYHSSVDVPLSATTSSSSIVDVAASGRRSLFSRFSFA